MSLKNIVITIAIILSLTACSDNSKNDELNSLVSQSTYQLRDLQGKTYDIVKTGNNFNLKDAKEDVVLFDLFATWCPPCRASAPNVSSLQKKFKDKIKIIGVLIEENKPDSYVQNFVNTYGADYTISNAKDNRKLASAIAGAIGVGQGFPIPLMVMYYKGKYVTHYVGMVPEEMIESDIKRVLRK